jgi:hypothetical protein
VKKHAVIAFIVMAMIVPGACQANDTKRVSTASTYEKISIGQLEIVTQGKTYIPIKHWVHSLEDGVAADGKYFDKMALEMYPDLKGKLEAAAPIPYAEDFRFFCVWPGNSEKTEINLDSRGDPTSFMIFDEQINRIANGNRMKIPPVPGLYYVAVEIDWGSSMKHQGYQYIFKVKVN